MKKCPACGTWNLDFDDYFGRFRCYNPDCGWMPMSSAEREIRLLRSRKELSPIAEADIKELGLRLRCLYDSENDALVFEMGHGEPTIDLPEPDGRMIWQVGLGKGSVVGFTLLGAQEWGVSEVQINFEARRQRIERGLRQFPEACGSGRATKMLVDIVAVSALYSREPIDEPKTQITEAFREAFSKFEEQYPRSKEPRGKLAPA